MKGGKPIPIDLGIILSNTTPEGICHKLEFSHPYDLDGYVNEVTQSLINHENQNFLFYLKTNIIRLLYEMSRMGARLKHEIKDVLIDLPTTLNYGDCFKEAITDPTIFFVTCTQNILAPGKALIVGDSYIHEGSHPYPQLYPNQQLFDNANEFVNLHGNNYILFMNSIIGASKLGTAHFQGQPSYSGTLNTIAISDDKKIPKDKIRNYVHELNKKGIPNTVIALGNNMFALMIPDYFLGILGKNPYISTEKLGFTLIPNAENGFPLSINGRINTFGIMAKELSNQIAIGGFELRNSNTVFLKELHGLLRLEKQLLSQNIGEEKLRLFLKKLFKKGDNISKTKSLRIENIINQGKQFIDKQQIIKGDRNQIIQHIYGSISSELRNSEVLKNLEGMDTSLLKKMISFLSINGDLDVFSTNKNHHIGFPNPEETEHIYSLCRSKGPLSEGEIGAILDAKQQIITKP